MAQLAKYKQKLAPAMHATVSAHLLNLILANQSVRISHRHANGLQQGAA